MINTFDYIAMVTGYVTICVIAVIALFAVLYIFYWVVLIPLHCSFMFNKAYRIHKDSSVWTDDYKLIRFKVIYMWLKGMMQPFGNYNAIIESSLITIDYTGRFPRTTIKK